MWFTIGYTNLLPDNPTNIIASTVSPRLVQLTGIWKFSGRSRSLPVQVQNRYRETVPINNFGAFRRKRLCIQLHLCIILSLTLSFYLFAIDCKDWNARINLRNRLRGRWKYLLVCQTNQTHTFHNDPFFFVRQGHRKGTYITHTHADIHTYTHNTRVFSYFLIHQHNIQ